MVSIRAPLLQKRTTRFLSVARDLGLLESRQARQIAEEQHGLRSAQVLRCGDIATGHMFLSPEAEARVVKEQRALQARGRDVTDVLSGWTEKNIPNSRSIIRWTRFVFAVLVVGSAFFVAVTGRLNIAVTAQLMSISSGVWLLIEALLPGVLRMAPPRRGIGRRTGVGRALRWIAIPVALFLYFLAVDSMGHLSNAWSLAPPGPLWVATGLVLLVVLVGVSVVWRHQQIVAAMRRSALFRQLSKRVMDLGEELRRNADAELDQMIQRVLEDSLGVLASSSYLRMVRKVSSVFLSDSFPALSAWYLVPHEREDGAKCLRIAKHFARNAPAEVEEAFEAIAASHFPVQLDIEKYRAVVRTFNQEGRDVREGLLQDLNRKEYLSLSGLVLYRGQAFESGDSDRCAAFDNGYLDAVSIAANDARTRRWLSFKSFAAYPVFADTQDGHRPDGVLVVFSNSRNAFTRADRDILVTTARYLGNLISTRRLVERLQSSNHGNQGT